MATFINFLGKPQELDPEFNPIPVAEAAKRESIIANAGYQGITPEQYVISRGGINKSGMFGDSYGINNEDGVSLTDEEYAATVGKGGAFRNAALAKKIFEKTGKSPKWWGVQTPGFNPALGIPAATIVTPTPTPTLTSTSTSTTVSKVVGTFTDPKTGDIYSLKEDGARELLSKGTKQTDTLSAKEAADAKAKADAYNAQMVADAKTQEIKAERQSAYETLKTEFTKYGLGSDEFLAEVKNLILTGTPTSQATLKLRATNEYAARFAGNQERRNAGKNVYDEATYLSLENQYRETFGAYGLDNLLGDTKTMQSKLAQYIAQDKSPLEIKKRVQIAVEQVQNRTDVRLMFAEYYPQITDKDLVSYFLEPQDTLASLQSKVNIASIGSTAMRQGLVADFGTAQALSEMGISEEQAAAGYKNVAAILPAAQKLTAIEGGKYTQSEAEGAYLKNLASEQRKIAKLAEREQARFTGSSGVNKASLTQTTKGQLY
jgi:hypothetical protein